MGLISKSPSTQIDYELQINLGSRLLDSSSLPYVIAEIGVNHEGSIDQARHLIDLAKGVVLMPLSFKAIRLILWHQRILLPIGTLLKSQLKVSTNSLVNTTTLVLTIIHY